MHTSARTAAAVLAAAGLAIAGAACGSSSGGSSGSGQKTMELIVGTKSDDFYVTMECGAEKEAKKLGVKLTVNGPATFSVPQQKPLIDSAAVTKPDALIVAPTDTSALDPDLTRVTKAGSKLIFVDTSSSDASLGLSRISSNNTQGGKVAADSLGQAIGGSGTVAIVSTAKGVSTTDDRVAGFQAEMAAKYPNVKILPEQNDDADSVTTAQQFIESDITANPNLSGVFAANVITAQGVAAGVAQAHKSGSVKVATFDADPQQMQMMSSGTIQLAIAQEPALEGADGVIQAMNAIEGKKVTKNIATPLIAVTTANQSSPSVKPFIYASSC